MKLEIVFIVSSSSVGVVFHEIHTLGKDPVDSRPVLYKFLRMGSCASLVIWILIRCLDEAGWCSFFRVVLLLSLAPKDSQLPFGIPGQWKDFVVAYFRDREPASSQPYAGRGSVPAPHLSRAEIIGNCFITSLCNIYLSLICTWTISF